MTVDLDALELVARAATPGPFDIERRDDDCGAMDYVIYGVGGDFCICFDQSDREEPRSATKARRDSTFIAAANPTVVLELVAEIRRLEAQRALWLKFTELEDRP